MRKLLLALVVIVLLTGCDRRTQEEKNVQECGSKEIIYTREVVGSYVIMSMVKVGESVMLIPQTIYNYGDFCDGMRK